MNLVRTLFSRLLALVRKAQSERDLSAAEDTTRTSRNALPSIMRSHNASGLCPAFRTPQESAFYL